jgi:hypothetical protein
MISARANPSDPDLYVPAWETPGLDPDDWVVIGERFDRDPNQLELPLPLLSQEKHTHELGSDLVCVFDEWMHPATVDHRSERRFMPRYGGRPEGERGRAEAARRVLGRGRLHHAGNHSGEMSGDRITNLCGLFAVIAGLVVLGFLFFPHAKAIISVIWWGTPL